MPRLAASIAGVTFAVLVIFVQLGFLFGLLDSAVAPIGLIAGDIVISSRLRDTLAFPERVPRNLLASAGGVPGVAEVRPVYVLSGVDWFDPRTGRSHPLRVFGIDPDRPGLSFRELHGDPVEINVLAGREQVLFDVRSKRRYFRMPDVGDSAELGGRAVRVAGTFALGSDFFTDGNIVVSDQTFARLFPPLAPKGDLLSADFAAVTVAPGHDTAEVRDRLAAALSADAVTVRTREQFENDERWFWLRNTPAGFVFFLGTAVGFLVGVVICYQILFAEVTDRTSEFATVMAMGYGPSFLAKVVLKEALLLSVFGFAAGLAGAWGVYALISWRTGLQLVLTPGRTAVVAVLTVVMCVLSGSITVRKVLKLDPAELF